MTTVTDADAAADASAANNVIAENIQPQHSCMLLIVGKHVGGKVFDVTDVTERFLTLFGFDTEEEALAFAAGIPGCEYYINGKKKQRDVLFL